MRRCIPMASAYEDGSAADLGSLVDLPFDELPPQNLIRAFGVDYAHLPLSQAGGDLYLTRHGWPFVQQLLPVNWYANARLLPVPIIKVTFRSRIRPAKLTCIGRPTQ